MSWSMRSLLICLLVLALPAQGWAAATMLFCKHGHQGGAAQQVHAQLQHHASAVTHAGRAGHGHHGMAVAAAHDAHHADTPTAAHAALAADSAKTDSPDGAHKCSACASCCSASAPPQALAGLQAPELTTAVFITFTATVEPFSGDALDRPPRSASA